MFRLILTFLVAFAAALYFPQSRAVLIDVAGPLLNPMFSMATSSEMDKIAREIQTYERTTGRMPEPRTFQRWLEDRYAGDAMEDSWGGSYSLEIRQNQFDLVSPGPDGLLNTDDDLVESWVID